MTFEPEPVHILDRPEQLKAFTDALRVRVLRYLCEQQATNQQIADAFGEPHAKVLYHVRYLVEIGLIRLVDTQVKGGNVEKYYRAIARMFDLRPPGPDAERDEATANALLDNLRADVLASNQAYPDDLIYIHRRAAWLTPQQAHDFLKRLVALMDEFQAAGAPPETPGTAKMTLSGFLFRTPPQRASDPDE